MALNRTCPTQVILDQTLICTQDKTVNRNRNTTNYTNGDKPVDTNTVLDTNTVSLNREKKRKEKEVHDACCAFEILCFFLFALRRGGNNPNASVWTWTAPPASPFSFAPRSHVWPPPHSGGPSHGLPPWSPVPSARGRRSFRENYWPAYLCVPVTYLHQVRPSQIWLNDHIMVLLCYIDSQFILILYCMYALYISAHTIKWATQ